MHLKIDLLRAYIDNELPDPRKAQVEEHLTRCPGCREELGKLQSRASRVQAALNLTAPGLHEQHPSPRSAYARFSRNASKHTPKKEIYQTMFNRKPLWTAIAVIAILAIAFSITPVRAWASSVLSLFRVQKITVIQFDPKAAENVGESMSANQEAIKAILKKNLKISGEGRLTPVADAAEAAAKAGFTPTLPAGMANPSLAYKPAMEAVFTIDQPAMQAVIDAIGANVQLPEAVNGKDVRISVPASIIAGSGCQPDDTKEEIPAGCTMFIQLPSPTVDAPQGLDIPKIGAAMLQLLGLSPAEAEKLSQRIDWTTTLILPVPTGSSYQASDFPVDGVSGTLLVDQDNKSFTLVWVKEGVLSALRGHGGADEAQKLVNP